MKQQFWPNATYADSSSCTISSGPCGRLCLKMNAKTARDAATPITAP